jgi:Leucine-rich repeat (LRR) protein
LQKFYKIVTQNAGRPIFYVGILVLFLSKPLSAQLLDSITIAHMDEFTNLDSALKNPDKVIKLVLKRKHLKEIPKEVFTFKNLQYLDVSKNSIKEVPEQIGQLTNLQYFICNKTGLERLPKEIGLLINLKYININQNDLESLPPQFGNLENLEIADMWSNNLAEFPETLMNLKSLKILDLRNILLSDEQQNHLQELMPKTKIFFSPSCKCKW